MQSSFSLEYNQIEEQKKEIAQLKQEIVRLSADCNRLQEKLENIISEEKDQKQAEPKLKEAKELLQRIMDAPNLGLAVCKAIRDDDGKIIDFVYEFVNRRTTEAIEEDVTGKLLTDYGEPGILQLEQFTKVIETGETSRFITQVEFHGSTHWALLSNSPIGDDRLVHVWEDITELKKTEQELLQMKDLLARKATDKYSALLNSIDEGLCLHQIIFDKEGKAVDMLYLEVNPAFERLTGIQNPVGKTARELFHTADGFWLEVDAEVAMTGNPVRHEEYIAALDKWLDVYSFRVDKPEDRHVAVLFKDITEKKKIEEVLRKNEARQAFLLQLSDTVRPMTDPLEIEEAVIHMLGKRLGVAWAYYCAVNEDAGTLIIRREYVADNIKSVAGDYRLDDFWTSNRAATFVTADIAEDIRMPSQFSNLLLTLSIHAFVARPLVKNGKLVAFLCISHNQVRTWLPEEVELIEEVAERTWDALERARAEEALRESEDRFRSVLDTSLDALYRFNIKTDRYEYFNPAFAKIIGMSAEEVMSMNLAESVSLTHPDDIPIMKAAKVHLDETGPIEIDYRVRNKNGEYRWISNNLSQSKDCSGAPIYFDGVIRDITERKQMEEQLRKNNEELTRINGLLEDFVRIAAHDLRSPIASLINMGNLIEMVPDLDRKLNLFNGLLPIVEKMQRTLDGLMETINVEQESELTFKELSFSEVFRIVNADLQEGIDKCGGTVIENFEAINTIVYEEAYLISIMKNLISNALKYSAEDRKPVIEVSTSIANKHIVLMVKDNGMGINLQQDGDNLFKPFRRFTAKSEGTGVGLYIIKKIIEKTGGYIRVESALNEGTTFYCYLKEYKKDNV